jgi:hypothetical protein
MRKLFASAVAFLGLGVVVALPAASSPPDDDKPKMSINDIMTKAHGRNGLRTKFLNGQASKDEKKELLDLYTDLAKNKPPKGDEASWKKRTDNIVKATKDMIDGKANAKTKFNNATRCKDCHDVHKGE